MNDIATLPATTEPLTDDVVTAAAKFDTRARELEAAKRLWGEIELEVRRGKLEPGEELTDDDIRTIQDSFDGATTLDTLIRNLLLDNIQLATVAPGIDKVVADLQARKARATKGMAWNKALIEKAMITAGWIGKESTFKCDVASVNVRRATATVEVVEESKIPSEFFVRAEPELSKAILNKKVLDRFKAMNAALALKDQTERETALAKVQEDFGAEIPGVQVKVDGYTTTVKYS